MKKSIAYKMAQISVLADEAIKSETKLYILSILMTDEKLAKWEEEHEAEEGAEG